MAQEEGLGMKVLVRLSIVSLGLWALLHGVGKFVRLSPEWPLWGVALAGAGAAEAVLGLYRYEAGAVTPRRGRWVVALRLMALAMKEHTAALPLVDTATDVPEGPPGKNTVAAMTLGILHAVAGGIDSVIRETASRCTSAPFLFLTGGDMTPRLAGLIQSRHQFRSEVRPTLTLEGILRTAEYLA